MSTHYPILMSLHLRQSSFSNLHCLTYVTAHSPTIPLLHLCHRSFSNPSVASPTSQALHLRHNSFSNPSVASPTSEIILQPFFPSSTSQSHSPNFLSLHFVTTHSATLPSLYLRHSSFSNPSVASPTSQVIVKTLFSLLLRHKLILQPFRHFTYITTHSPTLPSLYLHHSSFSNISVASPTSPLILQPFFHVSYVTNSFSNLSVTSPT